jgi:hypothetical protein
MNLKSIIRTATLGGLFLFSIESFGQSADVRAGDGVTTDRKIDSQTQQENDASRIANAKQARRETKAKAKEARRVEREADDAERQSKNALKTEERAQKSRKRADAQSQKASDARVKSDQN